MRKPRCRRLLRVVHTTLHGSDLVLFTWMLLFYSIIALNDTTSNTIAPHLRLLTCYPHSFERLNRSATPSRTRNKRFGVVHLNATILLYDCTQHHNTIHNTPFHRTSGYPHSFERLNRSIDRSIRAPLLCQRSSRRRDEIRTENLPHSNPMYLGGRRIFSNLLRLKKFEGNNNVKVFW